MNKCCMEHFKKLNDRILGNAEKILKLYDDENTVMGKAAHSRVEHYIEVCDMIKKYCQENL